MTFKLSPTELQTHFGPASECEGAEKEDEVEVDEEEAEFGPVLAPHADESGTAVDPAHSVVCTLNSAHSHEHQRSHHQLGAQLGRLKQETNRCMETQRQHIELKSVFVFTHGQVLFFFVGGEGNPCQQCTFQHTHTHTHSHTHTL